MSTPSTNNTTNIEVKGDNLKLGTVLGARPDEDGSYPIWSMRMEALLDDLGLWDNATSKPKNEKKSWRALVTNLSDEQCNKILEFAKSHNASGAWDILAGDYAVKNIPKQVTSVRELASYSFTDSDIIAEFEEFGLLANKLKSAFEKKEIDLEQLIGILAITALPDRFAPIRVKLTESLANLTLRNIKVNVLQENEAQKTTTSSANLMTSKQTKGAGSSTSGSKKTRCKHYWNKAKCWVCNPCSKCKEQGLEGSDTHHHSDKCTGKTEANLIEELLLTGVDDTSGSGPRTVSFAIDSGCTTHMVGNKGMVKPYSDHPILHKIRTAEAGRSITATARGSIEHSAGTLEKVLVVDEISRNLLSVSRIPVTYSTVIISL